VNKAEKTVGKALDAAWNRVSAAASMERWLAVCAKEGWGTFPEKIHLLAMVFGASWYFTRLIFFRGLEAAKYFDQPFPDVYTVESLMAKLCQAGRKNGLEENFDALRSSKNEAMLQILIAHLAGKLDLAGTEKALTCLAEATLKCALEIIVRESGFPGEDAAVLAMGRMAGREMNFGSDLDLIFLYSGNSQVDATAMVRQVQMLLRQIALPTPCGILYDIDMRLRPHGTSGTLITPAPYFVEYHRQDRPIWERQMMTRCRPVIDERGLARQSLEAVIPAIYGDHDVDCLRTEILQMRRRVEDELGNPGGKYEIKRGRGGIMDIDFLAHFLQLAHGSRQPELRTPGTREALDLCRMAGLLNERQYADLYGAYNHLKRIEMCLRLVDLKNISAFSRNPEDLYALARGMGFRDKNPDRAACDFLDDYEQTVRRVREHFTAVVGEP